ncbi:hypothetical protein AB1L30_00625, partial [Bremerella sp. JC817]|uniref:hypothetical protein n=1 Tax=Bremerella sp. JC817 TaxID=3231756 RepID=UPI003457F8E4
APDYDIPINAPYRDLTEKQVNLIVEGVPLPLSGMTSENYSSLSTLGKTWAPLFRLACALLATLLLKGDFNPSPSTAECT